MDDVTVDKAMAAIQAADLTPTEHLILLDFVKEAYEPTLTARLVLDRIRDNDGPVEETLRALKDDWHGLVSIISRPTPVDASLKDLLARRDPFRCCVSPPDCQQLDEPEPTIIIPSALSELVEIKEADLSSKSLLDAFMTPSRAARLKSMVSDRTDPGRLANAFFLAPSIQYAFKNGHLQVRIHGAKSWDSLDEDIGKDDLTAKYFIMPTYPEKYEDIVLADRTPFSSHAIALETEDPKQLPVPSAFLLKTHWKFANALHRFYVEERITEGWEPLQSPSFFSRSTKRIARAIWLLVPRFIRNACYRHLMEKIKRGHDDKTPLYMHMFPLGLTVQCYLMKHFNEPVALRLIEREAPSIPAPLLIDTFHYDSRDWFISTDLPGRPAQGILHRMSYPERDQLAADLSDAIAQMHKIPNTTPYRFASVTGGPIHDLRFETAVGPYNSEEDLNVQIAGGGEGEVGEAAWKYVKIEVPSAFSRTHDSVFTNGALLFNRILLDGGRFSGITDWQNAAFMPTYWEYAKAMRCQYSVEGLEINRKVWGDEFEMELEAEKWLWNVYPWRG